MTDTPVYIIEADNPDGTYSRVSEAGIFPEAENELRKAANRECMNPFGKARKLTIWHMPTATCLAIWSPAYD